MYWSICDAFYMCASPELDQDQVLMIYSFSANGPGKLSELRKRHFERLVYFGDSCEVLSIKMIHVLFSIYKETQMLISWNWMKIKIIILKQLI